jgi:hypothetical protein
MATSSHVRRTKKRFTYDSLDLSALPPGQRRAIEALIGGGQSARTYGEAARAAGTSLGTQLTHINRVRQNHPALYERIRQVRRSQLAVRHQGAVANARAHSRRYFRRQNRLMRQLGLNPLVVLYGAGRGALGH